METILKSIVVPSGGGKALQVLLGESTITSGGYANVNTSTIKN
jgi:hypothetical protein